MRTREKFLTVRVTEDRYEAYIEAANLKGRSLSEFVRSVLDRSAAHIIAHHAEEAVAP